MNCTAAPLPFNSIKVQLRPLLSGVMFANILFQFHKGTIKTTKELHNAVIAGYFQFHKGTIKTLAAGQASIASATFNSIKVQLRHSKDADIYIAF